METTPNTQLISVVVALFNRKGTLQRCIDSFINQTYPNKELIIIDGGSTDGGVDLLAQNEHVITYWETQPDRGITHAWNKALKKTKGDWILFLGADDYLWENESLRNIVFYLNAATTKIVYGNVARVTEAGSFVEFMGSPWSTKKFITKGCYFSHQGVFHHKEIFSSFGSFDESLSVSADYEMLLRVLKNADAQYVPDVVVSAMQRGGVSGDIFQWRESLGNTVKAQKKHGFSGRHWSMMLIILKTRVKFFLFVVLGKTRTNRIIDWYRSIHGRPKLWSIE